MMPRDSRVPSRVSLALWCPGNVTKMGGCRGLRRGDEAGTGDFAAAALFGSFHQDDDTHSHAMLSKPSHSVDFSLSGHSLGQRHCVNARLRRVVLRERGTVGFTLHIL